MSTAVTKEKTIKIKLPKRRDGERKDVYVSVNDRTWLIQRGVEVEVPECVAMVLEASEYAEDMADAYVESKSK